VSNASRVFGGLFLSIFGWSNKRQLDVLLSLRNRIEGI
jgi:hypothetical protein